MVEYSKYRKEKRNEKSLQSLHLEKVTVNILEE